MSNSKIKIGQKAPEFELPDQNGKLHKLSDYKGKKVLIYFYPKDNTPGCAAQACNFRENIENLEKLNLVVLGVSKDSVKSHKKFEEKQKLNFTLLSNESTDMIKSYDMWKLKKFMGREYMGTIRNSVLVDESGKIIKIYEEVKPEKHTQEVIEDVGGM